MMRIFLAVPILILAGRVIAQNNGFAYGNISLRQLQMDSYPADTSASAVMLNEFGEAYISDAHHGNLVFEYHAIIKVLKKDGLKEADISIPLHHQDGRKEQLLEVKGTSYNIENGTRYEKHITQKDIHTSRVNEYWDEAAFAIPDVREGTVIEIAYSVESPFLYNFMPWEFQSKLPKVKSEYWATIPANYVYNITFKGYLKLAKNENMLVKDCFAPGGGGRADCGRYKWAMDNIPAFVTEEFMTAKSNFIAQIKFELSEIIYFDGRKDRFTKEWKDAEEELRASERFGLQLKKGKAIVEDHMGAEIMNETDQLKKAQKIYSFVQKWFVWNEEYGKYSETGIKKSFDAKRGNVGDINLTLLASLRYAGIEADPLVLSTRANGLPTDLHPVLSDFNYVIAKVAIDGKNYLLDATDDFLPFGTIPERCLNGKGRVVTDKSSYWHDLKTTTRARRRTLLNMTLDPQGVVHGKLERIYSGYEAINERRAIAEAGSKESYFKELKSELRGLELTSYEIENIEDIDKPLSVIVNFEWAAYTDPRADNFLFNPFPFDRITSNPFRSKERFFPVDFGSSLERTISMTLEYPENFELAELPNKLGLSLPNATGRYLFDIRNEGNKIVMQSSLTIGKPIFTSDEYHFLKELYAQIVANQQTELLFKKKA